MAGLLAAPLAAEGQQAGKVPRVGDVTSTEDQRDRIAADLAKAEKEEQSYADAIGPGGDLPVLVAKLKGVSIRCETLRASLASHQAIADDVDDLDPEDLADALRLTHEGSPDLTADRKRLRTLGVQITVDQALRGSRDRWQPGPRSGVPTVRTFYVKSPILVGGPWISLWASTRTPRNFAH